MRFRNLEPPYEFQGIAPLLWWMLRERLAGRRRSAPARADIPRREPDLALIASDAPSLTWVGHATWLIRLAGMSFVTDPVWSDYVGPRVRRNVAPGIDLALAKPEVVLVSHNHFDHLDFPSIDRIGPAARYFVPKGMGPAFARRGLTKTVEMEWWQKEAIGDRVSLTFVPSQHWSQRGLFDRNRSLWGGYVLEAEGRSVYFAGDTAYFEGFAEIGRRFPDLDAALLPIGTYEPRWYLRSQHMDPADAVAAFESLGARRLCAMHWGTFKQSDEPLDEPPRVLEEVRRQRGIDADRVWVAAVGETSRLGLAEP